MMSQRTAPKALAICSVTRQSEEVNELLSSPQGQYLSLKNPKGRTALPPAEASDISVDHHAISDKSDLSRCFTIENPCHCDDRDKHKNFILHEIGLAHQSVSDLEALRNFED